MQFDVAALPAEDLEPLAKALSLAPPEKRGEVYMRIQNAGREFLAKATAGKPPSAATETDPIKRAVFGALTKQLPAPAPQLDPLKREALGSLEKAVMAGIRGAARGVGDALGVTGRAGAMRQMRGAYRSAKKETMADSTELADAAGRRASTGTVGFTRKLEAYDRGFSESMASSKKAARAAGRIRANAAVNNFNRRVMRNANKAGLAGIVGASAAVGAGATYAATRPRKQKDQ